MDYYKVEGHSNLVRDANTNAILNTNTSEYNNYINMRKMREDQSKKVEMIENELSLVKEDLNEIKSLLRSFVNGSK